MPRVVIYISGGVCQGEVADVPGIELMVVDYDNEDDDPSTERSFDEIPCDPELVERTIARREEERSSP